MLITALDGELLGIRVEWSIKPEYLGCQFTTLRVELNNDEVGKDTTPERVCWTVNITTTFRQSQHLLGPSSLPPSKQS